MTPDPLFLGVDLGTSSLKCGVFDLAGDCAGSARIDYETREVDGGAEQNAADWWLALVLGVREATAALDRSRIVAIGVGGHAPSPVFVDSDLQPVYPVLPWCDGRSSHERDQLFHDAPGCSDNGGDRLLVHLAARARWLRSASPNAFRRAARVLLSSDYLIARLTGELVITSPRRPGVFAAGGIPADLLPGRECHPGEVVATVSPLAAKELQLECSPAVVTGGLDSFLASVGSGMHEPGDACLNMGSSSGVALMAGRGTTGRFDWAGFPIFSRPIRTGGRLLDLAHRFASPSADFAELLEQALRLKPDNEMKERAIAFFQPAEQGDDQLRAALAAVPRELSPSQVFRQIIDAIFERQRLLLDELERDCGPARRIRAVGRLAARPGVAQLQANILRRTVQVPRVTDSAALGAAMVAATALGVRTQAEAAACMVRPGVSYDPRPEIERCTLPVGSDRKSRGVWSTQRSEALADRARRVIWKGGKESSRHESLRACGFPQFLSRGKGCKIWDVDGNGYTDYLMSWGTVLLGHAHEAVDLEARRQIAQGSHLNFAVEQEVALAERLVEHIPGADLVRFIATGAEATNAAVRIARAATGRDKIVHYGFHGWLDWCQAAHPAGIPAPTLSSLLSLEFNNLDALSDLFASQGDTIAGVIMEPVKDEVPAEGFLAGVRDLLHRHGALLVFDEAKTGFRFGLGGAQAFYGVIPDLSVFSKAVANGYPLAVVAGKADILERGAAAWVSGTYHGWAPAIAAAHATLRVLEQEPVVKHVWALGARLMDGFNSVMACHGLETKLTGMPPMPQLTTPEPERAVIERIIRALLSRGHFIHPIRPLFISFAHDSQTIDRTLEDLEIASRQVVSS